MFLSCVKIVVRFLFFFVLCFCKQLALMVLFFTYSYVLRLQLHLINNDSLSGCPENLFLHNGRCIKTCPDGFYNLTVTTERNSELEDLLAENNSNICLPCHYTCRQCTGSIDYQCTECFPDATLVSVSDNQFSCYPTSIASTLSSNAWYIRVFIMLVVITILLSIHLIWQLCRLRKKRKRDYFHLNLVKTAHNIESNPKVAVYSDSE
jgi:furin